MNDVSISTLDGGSLKSLLEHDGADLNIKGGTIESQKKHSPIFCTSNIENQEHYRTAQKSTSQRCTVTWDDWMKCFDLVEGRLGEKITTNASV